MGSIIATVSLRESAYTILVTAVVFLGVLLIPYLAGQVTPLGMPLRSGRSIAMLALPFFALVVLLVLFSRA